MRFTFYKYQGTGNDFIIVDDRATRFPADDSSYIKKCCDRRFGIGADGLILIQASTTVDFKMLYFNADGREGTLCGNGARCAVAFTKRLGIIEKTTTFEATDGLHSASIDANKIALRMQDLTTIKTTETYTFLDTGSPHHVEMVAQLDTFPVVEKGRIIRYGAPYFDAGTNVNFVEQIDDSTFAIRTYERGVEDETLSCGTGATAVAIAVHNNGLTTAEHLRIKVEGGWLEVSFNCQSKPHYTSIDLIGPATFVFKGVMDE
ncbi:MAG: diaminopimelate epimerase [Flavobacteriaceae bacterium]